MSSTRKTSELGSALAAYELGLLNACETANELGPATVRLTSELSSVPVVNKLGPAPVRRVSWAQYP